MKINYKHQSFDKKILRTDIVTSIEFAFLSTYKDDSDILVTFNSKDLKIDISIFRSTFIRDISKNLAPALLLTLSQDWNEELISKTERTGFANIRLTASGNDLYGSISEYVWYANYILINPTELSCPLDSLLSPHHPLIKIEADDESLLNFYQELGNNFFKRSQQSS